METLQEQQKLHSQDYFNEQRNYWWNLDFLELIRKRWQLNKFKSVLDVGCGIGHWGQLLARMLPDDCEFTGIDPEREWILRAKARATSSGLGDRFSYHVGSAENLPFPNETFDLVTCQTVLMHLKDPALAVKEFLRVLKPGGRIFVAEPNNATSQLILDSVSIDEPIDQILERVRFYLTCERGKRALGEGNSSIGCLVPGLFAEQGLKNIEVYQSDKASALVPPYDTAEQKVHIKQTLVYLDKGIAVWDNEESRRYFLAGGGTENLFDPAWDSCLERGKLISAAIRSGRYYSAGGSVFYLASGQKAY